MYLLTSSRVPDSSLETLGCLLNTGPPFECTVYTTCSLKTHDLSQPTLHLVPGHQYFVFPAIRSLLQDFTLSIHSSVGMHRRHSSKRCDVFKV